MIRDLSSRGSRKWTATKQRNNTLGLPSLSCPSVRSCSPRSASLSATSTIDLVLPFRVTAGSYCLLRPRYSELLRRSHYYHTLGLTFCSRTQRTRVKNETKTSLKWSNEPDQNILSLQLRLVRWAFEGFWRCIKNWSQTALKSILGRFSALIFFLVLEVLFSIVKPPQRRSVTTDNYLNPSFGPRLKSNLDPPKRSG